MAKIVEKSFDLKLDNLIEKNLDYHLIDSLWSNFHMHMEDMKKDFKTNNSPIKIEIDVTEVDYYEGHYRLEYKVIESSGPILGFLGFFVDMDTGYVVMSGRKKDELIAFFSLQDYLEKMLRVPIPLPDLKYFLEEFKLGNLTIYDFFDKLGKLARHNDTFTLEYFTEQVKNSTIKFEHDPTEEIMWHFEKCREWFLIISTRLEDWAARGTGVKKDVVQGLQIMSLRDESIPEEMSEDLNEFFSDMFSLRSRTQYFLADPFKVGNYVKYDDADMQETGEKIHRNVSAMALSSMPEPAFEDYVFDMPYSKFLAGDVAAMNLYDLLQETDKGPEFDDSIDNSEIDSVEFMDIIYKIGIVDYMSAYAYSQSKRGFDRKEALDIARRSQYSYDLDMSKSYTGERLPYDNSKVTHLVGYPYVRGDSFDYRKDVYLNISKFIERITKRLDSL